MPVLHEDGRLVGPTHHLPEIATEDYLFSFGLQSYQFVRKRPNFLSIYFDNCQNSCFFVGLIIAVQLQQSYFCIGHARYVLHSAIIVNGLDGLVDDAMAYGKHRLTAVFLIYIM